MASGTIGASGADWTTRQAFEDQAGVGDIGDMIDDVGTSAYTGSYTVSVSNVVLRADTGNGFRSVDGTESGAKCKLDNKFSYAMLVSSTSTPELGQAGRGIGFDCEDEVAVGQQGASVTYASFSNWIVNSCWWNDVNLATTGASIWRCGFGDPSTRQNFYNCVAVDCDEDLVNQDDDIEIYNCTALRVGTFMLAGSDGPMTVENCISIDAVGNDYNVGAGSLTADKNADSDGSAPGTTTYTITAANAFEDPTAGTVDLHPKTGTDLIDNGTNNFLNDDFEGNTRTSDEVDLGAYELVTAGVEATLTLLDFEYEVLSPSPSANVTLFTFDYEVLQPTASALLEADLDIVTYEYQVPETEAPQLTAENAALDIVELEYQGLGDTSAENSLEAGTLDIVDVEYSVEIPVAEVGITGTLDALVEFEYTIDAAIAAVDDEIAASVTLVDVEYIVDTAISAELTAETATCQLFTFDYEVLVPIGAVTVSELAETVIYGYDIEIPTVANTEEAETTVLIDFEYTVDPNISAASLGTNGTIDIVSVEYEVEIPSAATGFAAMPDVVAFDYVVDQPLAQLTEEEQTTQLVTYEYELEVPTAQIISVTETTQIVDFEYVVQVPRSGEPIAAKLSQTLIFDQKRARSLGFVQKKAQTVIIN